MDDVRQPIRRQKWKKSGKWGSTVEQKFDEIIPLICQYSRYNSYNRILGQELKVVDKRIIVVEKL